MPEPTGDELLPLIVAQYELKGHPRRTEHWNLIILVSEYLLHTFEVRGNTDSYTYVPELNVKSKLSNAPSYRGGCHIGNIPASEVETIKRKFKDVQITKFDPVWDSQVWVMDALKMLKENDYTIFPHVNESHVRNELSEDMERWDLAEDTVDERLLAGAEGHEVDKGSSGFTVEGREIET